MTEFQTLHTGRPLNLWERCCLTSFIDHAHRVVLFGYEPVEVPKGVRFAPAQDIVSEREREEFFRVAPRGIARFSDLFRWRMLDRHGGWWIDTDILCLSDELPAGEIVLGGESAEVVGTSILRFPAGHPLLKEASEFAVENQNSPGSILIGPQLLTQLVVKHGLKPSVREPGMFYPVHWSEVQDLVDPGRRSKIEKVIAESPVLHLWQQFFRHAGVQCNFMPPTGSYLHEAFVRHGGSGAPELDRDTYRLHVEAMRLHMEAKEQIARLQGQLDRARQELAFARAKA